MKTTLLSFALGIAIAAGAQAQTIAGWDFTGLDNVETATATTFDSKLITTSGANAITRGIGAAKSAGANSFRTIGFGNDGLDRTNTDYFEIKLQAIPGYKLSISNINAKFKGDPAFSASPGVQSQFAYSLDNGATFTWIVPPVLTPGNSNGEVDLPEVPTSSVSSLQNIPSGTSVTIRYFATGNTAAGSWGFYSHSVGVNGLSIGGTLEEGGAPVFAPNYPLADFIDQTEFDLFSNIDEPGNTYYVVLPDGADAPTALQVSQGQNADGSIATISGSFFNEFGGTVYPKTVTGLVADVAYDVYVIAKDLSDNLQASPVKIDIKTSAVPLPVSLAAFSGIADNGSILLNWNTVSEINNSYFIVERSLDGKNFTQIGKLNGAGNSTLSINYNFADNNPYAGTNYYRLVQYDYDGKTSILPVTAVDSKLSASQMNVYAGASQLKVFISSPNQTNGTLQVYDLSGRKLAHANVELNKGYNELNIPFTAPQGVNLVRYVSDSESVVKKFIK